jgi:hypothetical protein
VRVNGLALVIDRALASLPSVEPRRYRKALVLGSLREDVARAPFGGGVFEHLSFSHFGGGWLPGGFLPFLWPGPRFKVGRYFRRALAQARAGRAGAAYVTLGRACHVLTDMACPPHVHRVIHEADPFEWYVEMHAATLADAAATPPIAPPALRDPAALVTSLSALTRRAPADRTRNAIGRWLRRLGLLRPLPAREIARQARELIPAAAAHVAALIGLFLVASTAARADAGAPA